MDTREANAILKRVGAKELSKSPEGRAIIAKAAEKYRIELLQPLLPNGKPNPEFERYYRKRLNAQEAVRRQNEGISQEMWARREFIKQQRRLQQDPSGWKSKRL